MLTLLVFCPLLWGSFEFFPNWIDESNRTTGYLYQNQWTKSSSLHYREPISEQALTARLLPHDGSLLVIGFPQIISSSARAILEAHGEAGCVGSASLPAILVGLLLRSRLPKEVHNFVVHVASYHEKGMTFQSFNSLFCFYSQNIKYQVMMKIRK